MVTNRSVRRTLPSWVETAARGRRPAADVEHEVRRRRERGVQPLGGAEERQRRLALAGEHLELGPRVLPDRGRVPLPVRGVPHRAGRGDADPLGVEGPRPPAVPGEDLDRAPQRLWVQPAPLIHPVPEPRDDHVARELAETARRIGLGHEEPDRVRALVDGRDPTGTLLVDRLHALGDPGADRVRAAGQMVGVVGVEALDADPGPADAAERPGLRGIARPLGRVRVVGGGEGPREPLVPLRPRVQRGDGALGLQARDGPHRLRARQPEQRGEGPTFGVERPVADDERMARRATRDHGERDGRLAPELLANDLEIAPPELAHDGEATCACARRPA